MGTCLGHSHLYQRKDVYPMGFQSMGDVHRNFSVGHSLPHVPFTIDKGMSIACMFCPCKTSWNVSRSELHRSKSKPYVFTIHGRCIPIDLRVGICMAHGHCLSIEQCLSHVFSIHLGCRSISFDWKWFRSCACSTSKQMSIPGVSSHAVCPSCFFRWDLFVSWVRSIDRSMSISGLAYPWKVSVIVLYTSLSTPGVLYPWKMFVAVFPLALV